MRIKAEPNSEDFNGRLREDATAAVANEWEPPPMSSLVAEESRGVEPREAAAMTQRIQAIEEGSAHGTQTQSIDTIYPSRRAMAHQMSRLEEEVSHLREKLSIEKNEHRQTRRYLAISSEDLRSAGALLNKTDPLSYDEVDIMLKDLNHHIFELAAKMVDGALSKGKVQVKGKKGPQLHFARVSVTAAKVVGKGFFEFLDGLGREGGGHSSYHVILMRYTLQSSLVLYCNNVLERSRWSTDNVEERALRRIYQRFLGDNKYKTLAGRWRTLTRAVCQAGVPPINIRQTAKELLIRLRPILRAYGFYSAAIETPGWLTQFLDLAISIIEGLLQVEVAIREQVSTIDILPAFAPPGSKFDAHHMEDGNASGQQPSEAKDGEAILVPIGLGFTWTRYESHRTTTEYLVKPKVVLHSAFQA